MPTVASVRDLLTSPVGYLRIVFALLGAALALSFALLDVTLIALMVRSGAVPVPVTVLLGLVLVVAPVVLLGLTPPVRQVEGVAAESLLGVRFPDGSPAPAASWLERRRSLAWFVLHVLVGAVVLVLVVVLTSVAASLVATPFRGGRGQEVLWLGWAGVRSTGTWADGWMPVAGLLLVAATALLTAVLGSLMARVAPALLGPSYDERLRRLEDETARLVERNRIAREIHDSVGHALSLVTVQAAAARKVIDRDPMFAVDALAAIETVSRDAVADLDHMLGLLRNDGDSTTDRAPTPDLSTLSALLSATRAAGLDVRCTVGGETSALPTLVSREAYRIVQEGLTNALRHSSDRTAEVRIVRRPGVLEVALSNPYVARTGDRNGREGRGLRGIEERVRTLGGSIGRDATGGLWRLTVTLPVSAGGGP